MPVIWRTRALSDVSRTVRYIAADNPVAASRAGREPLLAGDSLTLFPRRGRPGRQPETRELIAAGPYIIVYGVADPDMVTISRVWHGAQDRP